MIATTVPVTILPAARERIDELGRQKEFEEMLEHAMQTVPGLVRIEVTYADYEGTGHEPVVFEAVVKTTDMHELIAIERTWNSWRHLYPFEIFEHFLLTSISEANYTQADEISEFKRRISIIAMTVPVTILPAAQERIVELARQKEFAEMLEHTMQTIPELVRIDVKYADYEATGHEPIVFVAVVKATEVAELIALDEEWNSWCQSVYPYEIFMYFLLTSIPEANNAP